MNYYSLPTKIVQNPGFIYDPHSIIKELFQRKIDE
jgi:hypothetical protein